METFKSIAYKILKKEGRPLHSKELVKKAIEWGLVTNGRTPEATMNAILITDINKNKKESEFKKFGPAVFGLNDQKSVTVSVETEKVFLPNKDMSSKQKGDIAEARIAELIMLYGKNPSFACYRPISDDEGIDLIVKRKGEFKPFFIQVKSRFGVEKKLSFTATVKAKTIVNNYSMGVVFCYFDMLDGDIWDYLWFVPAPDFIKKANKLRDGESLGFVAGKTQRENNKWDEYLIPKQELAIKIASQINKL